ncbi:hypothetical protein CEP52_017805, partial [Fusarium oligoseptatum]
MRLLNSDTYRLEEFGNHNIPLYAILSHRWGEDEITVAYQALAPLVQLPAGSCDCLIRQHFHLCIKSCMTQRVLPLSSCSLDNSHQLTGAINDPCGANCLT